MTPIPILTNVSCLITEVIRTTLASCDYTNCNKMCYEYLWIISNECPHVFNNEKYVELWNTLFHICLSEGH